MHSPRSGRRLDTVSGGLRLLEVLVLLAVGGGVAYFAIDGFKEIIIGPPEWKPKPAEEGIAELRVTIARQRAELAENAESIRAAARQSATVTLRHRSALSTVPLTPPPPKRMRAPPPPPREELPSEGKVVVLTAMQPEPCEAPGGDLMQMLSVRNKQDYARLHGYEFVLGTQQVDPKLENMWNKLGWIMRVLQDATLAADWVLWVDIDTVVLDANFTLPFNEYVVGSHDLVLYGNQTEIENGHPVKALNTGVMLIRNTPWARRFFGRVAALGRLDDHHKGRDTLKKILLQELQEGPYSDGLRDQNAVIYLLKRHPDVYMEKVRLVDKEVCLNCYWRDLLGETGYAPELAVRTANDTTFIQHFMGCQICSAQNLNGDLAACMDAMRHSFEFAAETQAPLLQRLPGRPAKDLALLAELPSCRAQPDLELCTAAGTVVLPRTSKPAAGTSEASTADSDASAAASDALIDGESDASATELVGKELHPDLLLEGEPQGNSDKSSSADSTKNGEHSLHGAAWGPASEPGATRRFLKGRRARQASRKRRLGSD